MSWSLWREILLSSTLQKVPEEFSWEIEGLTLTATQIFSIFFLTVYRLQLRIAGAGSLCFVKEKELDLNVVGLTEMPLKWSLTEELGGYWKQNGSSGPVSWQKTSLELGRKILRPDSDIYRDLTVSPCICKSRLISSISKNDSFQMSKTIILCINYVHPIIYIYTKVIIIFQFTHMNLHVRCNGSRKS